MEVLPWSDDLTARLSSVFGDAIGLFGTYREQQFLVARPAIVLDILRYLKTAEGFEYLVDVTAVDYPERAARFELIYILYNYSAQRRVRIKTEIQDGYRPASAVPVFLGANWLEREGFDMFGIEFDGHPDMKRILLPDGWKGHPLRRDYNILQMDNDWVQANLGIESGQ